MNQETCEPRWSSLADRLIQHRYICLGLAMIVGIFAYSISGRFLLERRIESMFRADDPVLANYLELRDKFGGNEVILVVFADKDFWKPGKEKLQELASLHDTLVSIDGIRGVMDLSVVDRLIRQIELPMSLFGNAQETSGVYSKSPLAVAMLDLFVGTTHAVDGPWLAVACLLDPLQETSGNRKALIAKIRRVMEKFHPNETVYLVGEPMMVEEGFEMIEADGRRLGWISSLVLGVLMLVVHRNIRWTLLTLIVIQWALTVTRAVCVLAGWELTMVSSMLIAIVTVIGIATTMHWLFSYQKLSRSGLSHLGALRASLRQSLRPIVWACVTDALAFSSLMAAAVEPVRDYGLMMAIASLATLLAIVLIGPGLASLGLSARDHVAITALSRSSSRGQPQPIWIEQFLLHALNFFIQHRTYTLSLLAVWILFVILGSSRLTVETDFLRNFREDSSLVQGYSIVEQRMGGAGVWDVLLPAPVPLTHQYLEVVLQLEDELRQLNDGALSKVLSLADADAAARQSRFLAKLPSQARIAGMQAAMPSFFDSLIALPLGEANQTLRIMLRASERLSASEKTQLIKMVEDCCKRTLQTTRWQEQFSAIDPESLEHRPVVTGYYVLLSHLVQSVVADQWTCFAIATFSIFIALCITTRSWKLSLVALVPNTLPALGAIAAFGVFGWKMNLGAAMIAAVSIGLSVDSSLHYLIDYQRGRRSGLKVIEALERSQLNVGMPVLLSTIALVIGFASLTVSDFLPTVVFGALASITMAIGLIGNLWWLPVLIDLVETKPM